MSNAGHVRYLLNHSSFGHRQNFAACYDQVIKDTYVH